MSAGCVRWVLTHGARTSGFLACSHRSHLVPASWIRSPFSTAAGDAERTPAPKNKKPDPRASANIGNVGRKIPDRVIQLMSEEGEDLGPLHRAHVVRIMNEKNLKLVLIDAHKDPPVYQLMSGKQIYQEQLKQREKQKAKAAPVQVKELTFSPGIASHDLSTKLKQVESWLEKKHHVRITLRAGRRDRVENLDTSLEQMVQQMETTVAFVSKPRVIHDGQAAMCILRPPSAKETSQKEKSKAAAARTDAQSSADAARGSTQQ